MSKQLEKMMKVNFSGKDGNHNDRSMRTMKSYSNYDVKSFMPRNDSNQRSRITEKIKDRVFRDKNMTEPTEKAFQANQFIRKIDLIEEEKDYMKKEIENLRQILYQKDQIIAEKDETIHQNKNQIRILGEQLTLTKHNKNKNRLVLNSNKMIIQVAPRYKQRYEVSIQTDERKESIKEKTTFERTAYKGDRDMNDILDRLEGIKFGAIKPIRTSNYFQNKSTKSNLHFDKIPYMLIDDKENKTNNSNYAFDKNKYFEKKKYRNEKIEIYPTKNANMEQIVEEYMRAQ